MRDRARLIEVLATVNNSTVDGSILREAGTILERGPKAYVSPFIVQRLRNVSRISKSPYLQDLAAEAIHYLTEAKHV